MKASSFFTKEQQAHIREAITEAEKETSGEIRVHIETHLSGDILDRASWIFKRIGMHQTKERNGVLFYLAVRNRKFAIIGDAGINAKVSEGFWDKIKGIMEDDFREKKFTEGLAKGILMAGNQLREQFPHLATDVNELSDEISFGDPDLTGKG
jgi:Predicted membrane protein